MRKITHDGIVDSVSDDLLRVRIMQSTACSSCKVSKHCNALESKEKIVEIVDAKAARRYRKGDSVTISMPGEKGHWAVFWAFLLPLALMVAVLLVLVKTTGDEGIAALGAVGILIPYYLAVFLLRGRLATRFTFTIEHDSN